MRNIYAIGPESILLLLLFSGSTWYNYLGYAYDSCVIAPLTAQLFGSEVCGDTGK